jgi:predicted Fe-S protein YdhL (DUF1289 family)
MAEQGAVCDRCGRSLATHEAWTLVQDGARSALCEACALDVGPALEQWSPGSEVIPPPPRPPKEARDAMPKPIAAADRDGGWGNRHPIIWLLGSLLLLVLALAPFVFFYWLASR